MALRFAQEQVRRFNFYKQHLTANSRANDPVTVVRELGPLRARPTITPYLALHARVRSFTRQQLDAALYQQHTLVRVPTMHARLSVLATDQYPCFFQVTREQLQVELADWIERWIAMAEFDEDGLSARRDDLVQRILEVSSTRGPSSLDELANLLPILKGRVPHDPDLPELGHTLLGARLLPALCAQGLLVRAQPQGGWRSESFTYATLASWVPGLDLEAAALDEALQQVIYHYIATYGPATIGDLSQWLGSPSRSWVVSGLLSLGTQLAHVQIEGSHADYYLVAEQLDALAQPRGEEPDVALLPPRDSYLLAYNDHSRFVADGYRERVFDQVGDPLGTVWWDGQVIGTWTVNLREETISLRFFEKVTPHVLAVAGESARRVARLLDFSAPVLDMATDQEEDDAEGAVLPVRVYPRS